MLGLGMFSWVVADAANTGHEDHRRGTDSSHHLRIMAGPRGHSKDGLAQHSSTRLNGTHDYRVEGYRLKSGQSFGLDPNSLFKRKRSQKIGHESLGLLQLLF